MRFEQRIGAYELVLMLLIELLVLPLLLPGGFDFTGAWDIGIIISELVIVVPALLLTVVWYFINMYKSDHDPDYESITLSDRLMFKPVKVRTVLYTILLTIVLGPIMSFFNSVSLIFVDNVVVEQSEEILGLPFWVAFFITAIYGPLCEEFAFRGIVYGGFRRYCKPQPAVIVSGLIFGLMHLNLNQFGYAFALGVAMALVVEASGSIWMSFLIHLLVNGTSVVYMYLLDNFSGSSFSELAAEDLSTTESMIPTIIILALISVGCFLLAMKILSRISKIENREDTSVLMSDSSNYKGGSAFSLILVLAMVFCIYLTMTS